MKIEIWSDIACLFCYIGKAHFEKALELSPYANQIDVEYRAYQLDPQMKFKPGQSLFSYLSQRKGMSEAQVHQMTDRIVMMATQTGLSINFDINIPANTLDAHRLIKLAGRERQQNSVLQSLFEAHFSNGQNIEDPMVLQSIGEKCGLNTHEIKKLLDNQLYDDEVKADIDQGKQFGVSGVPFFVFDRKYIISGAQPVDAFSNAIRQSFEAWQ